MKKKSVLYIICFVLICILASCGYSEKADQSPDTENIEETAASLVQYSMREMTLREALEMFPVIIKGYCSAAESDGMLLFSVTQVLRGEVNDQILVKGSGISLQKSEKEIILFAEPFATVMNGKDYYVAAEAVREEQQEAKSFHMQDLKTLNYESFCRQLPNMILKTPCLKENKVTGDFIHSDDMREIYDNSPVVVKGVVQKIERILPDRMWCYLHEISMIKGRGVTEASRIVLPLNSAREGDVVTVFLREIEGNAGFIISAPQGIINETN